MRIPPKTILLLLALALFAGLGLWGVSRRPARVSGVLPQGAYVWQRAWTEAVNQAVSNHAPRFKELIVLAAEVSWSRGNPSLICVPLDYPALRASGRPIGLALRIGGYPGPFDAKDRRTHWLAELCAQLAASAASNQLALAELQLDFDCAEAKLDGYRVWVEGIRRAIAPVPVTITALPSWLKRPAFKRLIATTDGFVLQVHSLERPRGANLPFVLCDPDSARAAVIRAARYGKPFRVALPTYGYRVAFDTQGRWLGLSAEGPAPAWPEGAQVRAVRADPQALGKLVDAWTCSRPPELQGLLWYRLPVAGDRLNWSWPTLEQVMAGRSPSPAVQVKTRFPTPELAEIVLFNAGQSDQILPVRTWVRWHQARLVAADGLHGYAAVETGANALVFRPDTRMVAPLAPGQDRPVGWVRFNQRPELEVEIEMDQPQIPSDH